MADGEGGDYKVGYRKPPLHTRFRKGRSGNPSGRPRGSRSTAVLLRETLQAQVKVNHGGKVMSKREVIITQQVNKAMTGDRRAARFVLLEIPQHHPNEFPSVRSGGLTDAAEARIRAALTGQPWIKKR